MGVTGAREHASADAAATLVARTRAVTDLPVCVGLGVSTGDQAAEVAAFADGVIVGSAFVRALLDAGDARRTASARSRRSPPSWPKACGAADDRTAAPLASALLAVALTAVAGCADGDSSTGEVTANGEQGWHGTAVSDGYPLPGPDLHRHRGQARARRRPRRPRR